MKDHAVLVYFDYKADSVEPLFDLENQLEAAIIDKGVGEFDGNEIAVDLSNGSLYMYGPDAEAMFLVVRPILAAAECLQNLRVILRFGPAEDGVPERVSKIEKSCKR